MPGRGSDVHAVKNKQHHNRNELVTSSCQHRESSEKVRMDYTWNGLENPMTCHCATRAEYIRESSMSSCFRRGPIEAEGAGEQDPNGCSNTEM